MNSSKVLKVFNYVCVYVSVCDFVYVCVNVIEGQKRILDCLKMG